MCIHWPSVCGQRINWVCAPSSECLDPWLFEPLTEFTHYWVCQPFTECIDYLLIVWTSDWVRVSVTVCWGIWAIAAKKEKQASRVYLSEPKISLCLPASLDLPQQTYTQYLSPIIFPLLFSASPLLSYGIAVSGNHLVSLLTLLLSRAGGDSRRTSVDHTW